MKISKTGQIFLSLKPKTSHFLKEPDQLFSRVDNYQKTNVKTGKLVKEPLSFSLIQQGAVIKKGAKGQLVKSLQERLTALGFGVQSTGIFGSTTEAILKKFQRAYRVQPTGQLGPTTLKALEKAEQGSAGKNLARKAGLIARSRQTTGWCYNAVYHAITPLYGDFLRGASAYLAAPQLANHPRFKEISVRAEQLPRLKAGSVVVWGKSSRSPHGHISISLGNGQEASDHIDRQRTHLRGIRNFRVFVPA